MRITPPLPTTSHLPSGEKASVITGLSCLSVAISWPVAASHSRTVLSKPPPTSHLPSGEKATVRTMFACPRHCRTSLPVATSHSRTVLSKLPVASHLPSGENAADVTVLVWPAGVSTSWPLWAAKICTWPAGLASLTISSPPTATTRRPSGEKATANRAVLRFASQTRLRLPASRTATLLSRRPTASNLPSGEKAREVSWSPSSPRKFRTLPLRTSQRRTVPLLPRTPPAEASSLPSGENATALTASFWGGSRRITSLPGTTSHTLTVPSRLPLANRLASGEKTTDMTVSPCPWIVTTSFQVSSAGPSGDPVLPPES